MRLSDGVPSSPGPGASLEDQLKYYKEQYELLEAELADFQTSSKDLEAELEKDIEASEKRERQLKDKASNLQYEVDEWKTKYKQSKTEASNAQNTLQKEITELRESNRQLQMRLRDIEVANDDYERKQRNTESSLEDLESKFNQTIERSVMLEEEVKQGEQEREGLRIEAQRLKDELADLKIEADITKDKLRRAADQLARREKHLTIHPVNLSASPRSELSPTTTNASSPTFDTPPAKTASSSGLSDTPTPPSPPISERSAAVKPFATPGIPKSRQSIGQSIPRPASALSKTTSHARGTSVAQLARTNPTTSSSVRQSLPRPSTSRAGLPQSSSILHLRNMRGKIAKLEERVHTARSKLPAPVHTPPRASPRSGSALGTHSAIPSSVTVRSRKRATGSTVSGADSLSSSSVVDATAMVNTPSLARSTKPSRQSLLQQQQQPPPSPTRGEMAAPPLRPSSRASTAALSSRPSYVPTHSHSQSISRPSSRASVSYRPLGAAPTTFTPNASTNYVRPKSSLSIHGGDGALDEEGDSVLATPTPRRATFAKRTSDVGATPTGLPSPKKRESLSKLPQPRRMSGFGGADGSTAGTTTSATSTTGEARPGSRLDGVVETYDINETF